MRGWSVSFAAGRITMTGNPLRGRFSKEGADRGEALEYYGFTPDLPVVLVVGGSLGTRSLNEMMKAWILALEGGDAPVQVIWQTGKYYEREMQAFSGGASGGEYLAGGLHRPHGLCLCGGRSGPLAQRGGDCLGVVSGGEARVVRALAQCGRGSSRPRMPRRWKPRARRWWCLMPRPGRAAMSAGDGAALGRGGFADDERKPRKAGAPRCGGADRG